jgi:hypothetical protein
MAVSNMSPRDASPACDAEVKDLCDLSSKSDAGLAEGRLLQGHRFEFVPDTRADQGRKRTERLSRDSREGQLRGMAPSLRAALRVAILATSNFSKPLAVGKIRRIPIQ